VHHMRQAEDRDFSKRRVLPSSRLAICRARFVFSQNPAFENFNTSVANRSSICFDILLVLNISRLRATNIKKHLNNRGMVARKLPA
jgi:hypothetical protein